ncbi:hypothetical protein RM530_17645 [Algiphilus sp. W345]|uniref:Uncharacterized protein n=1 Tax=Banduia mediterranea TaxID=3075609 RepID=A0ABU2WMR9_9GAMM|nr:hypothetical protein [Algiphilus sp. W345]MDT0499170.1 hypothetical protein [Algiphilus sp. W345]
MALDSVPVNGRITLRERRDDRMRDYEEQSQAAPERRRSRERSR